jgi:ion channel
VGLGDLSPKTATGKIFTIIYIFGPSIILGFIDAVSKETLGRRRKRQHSSDVGQDDEDVSGS